MNASFLRQLAEEISQEAHRYTNQAGREMCDGCTAAAQCSATASRVLGALAFAINSALDKEAK